MSKKLEKLLKQEQQLKAQIQLAQAAERTKEKKKDTRRRILIGSAIMAQVEAGEFTQKKLTDLMDAFLTRPNERELFGLKTPEAHPSSQKQKKASPATKRTATTKKPRTSKKATTTAKTATKKTQPSRQAASKSKQA